MFPAASNRASRGSSLRTTLQIFWFVLGCLANGADAATTAAVQVTAETLQSLLPRLQSPRQLELELLRVKLEALEAELGPTPSAGAPGTFGTLRGHAGAHLQELRGLRLELADAIRGGHRSVGSNTADRLLVQVHARFDRLEQALAQVEEAKTTADRLAAEQSLRVLLVSLREPSPVIDLTPNLRQIEPVMQTGASVAAEIMPAYAQSTLKRQAATVPGVRALAGKDGTTANSAYPNTLVPSAAETASATPPAVDVAASADCAAIADDLAADGAEIQLTAEIKALAASLNYSPVQMLAWIQKNIQFQPYWGSAKGAAVTLTARAGNATDQASLLIALLRSANVPARFVRGVVSLRDTEPKNSPDGRAQRWLGTKTYAASLGVISRATLATASTPTVNGSAVGIAFDHVWVEACLPYAAYRGARSEALGYRWQPLEPSIKDHDYQAGIAVDVALDSGFYSALLARRSDDSPNDVLAQRTEAAARSLRADASIEDVPYTGRPKVPRMDVLPGSPPFEVIRFTAWPGTSSAETARIPDAHRWQLRFAVTTKPSSGTPVTLATTNVSLPSQVLSKVTLSYLPTSDSLSAWNAWSGSLLSVPAGSISVYPRMMVDGAEVVNGAAAPTLSLGGTHNLVLELRLGERTQTRCGADPDGSAAVASCINKAVYNNITAGGYYALGVNAGQASTAQLARRAAALADGVRNNPTAATPASGAAYDATVGELLHLVLASYAQQISLGDARAAALRGHRAAGIGDLGITGADLKTTYAFDIPVAVKPGGPYVDYKGGQFSFIKLDSSASPVPSGGQDYTSFFAQFNAAQQAESNSVARIANYGRSALEHEVWQQTLRTDAVSTVRGLQFANETGIPLRTLSPSDQGNVAALLPALSAGDRQAIAAQLQGGATVTVPANAIAYTDPVDVTKAWRGVVYMTENASSGEYGAIISGSLAGGYPLINSTPLTSLYTANSSAPSFLDGVDGGLGRLTTLPTGQMGNNPLATLGGDPVNMVTGHFVSSTVDLQVKARGGFNAVFERWYNSGADADYGLGRGWTHSFNHRLNVYGVENGRAKIGWLNGSGGEAFFSTTSVSGGEATPGTTLTPSAGNWSSLSRAADGTYLLREQNGTTYVFEPAVQVANQYRLRSIADRNGNLLSVAYLSYYVCGTTACGVNSVPLQPAYSYAVAGTTIAGGKDSTRASLPPEPSTAPLGPTQASAAANRGPTGAAGAVSPAAGFTDPRLIASDKIGGVSDGIGRTVLQFTWDASYTHLKKVQDIGGRQVGFAFTDGAGNLNQVTDARGKVHGFTYYTAADGPKRDRRLKTLVHPKGNGLQLEYYSNGQVFRHTALDFTGAPLADATTTFEYNLFTRESTTTNERGYRRSYLFDSNGNPLRITDENGASTTYSYDTANPFNRVTETDSIGRTTRYSYVSGNLVDTVTLPNLSTLVFKDYTVFAQAQRSQDARGNWRWMRYDAKGNLTDTISLTVGTVPVAGVQPSAGVIKAWARQSYDAYGNPTTTTPVSNFSTGSGPGLTLNYDANRLNVLSMTRQGNRSGSVVNETTSPNFEYDALNRPKTGVDSRWYPTASGFDEQDRPKTRTDARGKQHSFVYDDNGNPTQRDLQDGDDHADSSIAIFDERDRLTSRADAGGNVTVYAYDAAGNVIQVTSPDGYATYVEYDAANRPVATFDESGNRTQVQLDTQGRELSRTDPNGNTVARSYWNLGSNGMGRLRRIVEPLIPGRSASRQTEFGYDSPGNIIYRTRFADNGSQRQSFSSYDELGRVVRSVGEPDDLGQRLQTCLKFDTLGNLTEVWAGPTTAAASPNTDGTCNFADASLKLQLQQSFDDFGQLLSRTDALGKTWRYSYDYYGNLATSQSPEQAKLSAGSDPLAPANVTRYVYDASKNGGVNGLPSSRSAPDGLGPRSGPVSSYRYNSLGQLLHVETTEATSGTAVTYDYVYDAAHRVSSAKDSRGRVLVYGWTLGGRLASQELRASLNAATTHRWDYKYDNLGRLSLIVAPNGQNASLLYDAAGRLVERDVTRAENSTSLLRSIYSWQADGRLAGLSHRSDEAELLGHSYTFDAWGNRWQHTRRTNTRQVGSEVLTYGYDSLDRLTSVTAGGSPVSGGIGGGALPPTEAYGYDLFGNRTSRTSATPGANLSWSYTYDAGQRMTDWTQFSGGARINQALLRYDDNGNLTVQCDSGSGGSVADASNGTRADCTASGASSQRSTLAWDGLDQLRSFGLSRNGTPLLSEAYAYDDNGRRVAKALTRNNGPEFTPLTLTTQYLYAGADAMAEWFGTNGIGSNFIAAPRAVYAWAGTDQPVLRSFANDTADSASVNGGTQVFAQDGLGSVVGALAQQQPQDLTRSLENTLSSVGGFGGGSYSNPNWGQGRDRTYFQGDSNVSATPSVTLTLAQPTRVSQVSVVPDSSLVPAGYRISVQDTSGNWQEVASAAGGGGLQQFSFASTLARAVRVECTGGGLNSQVPNRVTIASWQVYTSGSVGDDYAASTQSFDAWGNVTQSLEGVPTFGFTGREPDASGLTYYRARYYSPGLARFVSRDPMGMGAGINPYAYVDNNPTNMVDPMGLAPAGPLASLGGCSSFSCNLGASSFDWIGRSLAKQIQADRDFDSGVDAVLGLIPGYDIVNKLDKGQGISGGDVAWTAASMMPIGKITRVVGEGALAAGQGGRFGSLIGAVGDDLTAHHIPQAALGFTSKADGGAIVMTTAEHFETRTYGFKGVATAVGDAASSFRDVLAKDIRDVRTIVGNAYNEGLQDVMKYYRENFPQLMKKEKKP